MGQDASKPIDIAALSALSVVRIRKKLPPDEVKTVGGGCIVKWVLGGSASSLKKSTNSSVFLLTTTQVITKNDLIASDGSISVELFNGGKIVSFNLGVKCATDLLEPLPGRVLREMGEALKEVSFIMIPAEKFDDRNWFWSTFQGNIFEKRSLTCSPPSDETLQTYILKREVFCCVTCDDRTRNNRRFDNEIYCLEFDKANSEEFVLTSVSSQDCTEEIRRLKQDFYRGENPKGALLISKDGHFFGMLAISPASNEIVPLFLPTLDIDNNGTTVGKDVCNIVGPFTKTSSEAGGGPLKAIPDEHDESSQEASNKMMSNNQDVPLEGENLGNYSTSEVQGSGNPVRNPQELANSSSGLDLVQADHENENLNPDFDLLLRPEVEPSQDGNDHDDIEPECPLSLPPENVDHAIPPEYYSPSPPAHHEPLPEDSDCSSNLDGDVGEQEQPLSESSGSPKPIPETEPPKQINEVSSDIRNSGESGDDLVFSTEPERLRGFRGCDVPRSLSEADNPSRSDGVQGSGPLTRQNTTPRNLERVFSDSKVKDKIVNRAGVMDVVSLHLDRPNCPGKRQDFLTPPGWEQLADEYKVQEEIKRKCQNFFKGNLSPSNAMFEYIEATSNFLNIGITKTHLRKLGRNDIICDIDKVMDKDSGLSDDITLTDLWNLHPETLWTVCLRLDDQRNVKNWMDLGSEIGLPMTVLRKFKDPSGDSPSKAILEKIKSLHPTLSITRIQTVLRDLNLRTVERKLDPLRGGDIRTLLGEIDILEDVTGLLDLEERYWRSFALKFHKFSVSVLDSLRPEPISSPTKMVLNYIVQENPQLTMRSFLLTLEKMERRDLILELKEFFKPQDIDEILSSRVA